MFNKRLLYLVELRKGNYRDSLKNRNWKNRDWRDNKDWRNRRKLGKKNWRNIKDMTGNSKNIRMCTMTITMILINMNTRMD